MLVSTVTVEPVAPGVIVMLLIAVLSFTDCVPFVTVVGVTGVTTAAGLEFAFLGSDPFAVSTVSGTPSPSSSVSVMSGSPSPSVSLSTVISTVLVILEPSGFVMTTGISNLRFSSVLPQSVTFGVPLIVLVPASYVIPFGSLLLSTDTVALLFPGVTTILLIAVLSLTLCVPLVIVVGDTGTITAAGTDPLFLGLDPLAFSSTSDTPSPSSSGSVISGSPSPSVSLSTVISTVLVILEPSGFVTTTGTSNLRFSSVLPQSVTFGVPLIVLVAGL